MVEDHEAPEVIERQSCQKACGAKGLQPDSAE